MLNLKSKQLKYGAAALAATLIVVAVVVLLNVIVHILGERYNLKADLTPDSIFDISAQSKDYLKNLSRDVEIVVMTEEASMSASDNIYIKHGYEVLQKYAINSDRVSLTFVNLTKNPTYAERYSAIYSGSVSQEDIIVNSGGRMKVVSVYDLYNTEFSYQTWSEEIVSSKAEQVLTSAIMYVTDANPVTAVILEVQSASYTPVSENIAEILSANGYNVETVNPYLEAIPEYAALIVIDAPLNDFPDFVIENIYNFMENDGNYGKNMVYLASYDQNITDNIDAFLAEWGIAIDKSIIADEDPDNLASAQTAYALRNIIESNDYSENVVVPSLPVISYEARPLIRIFETRDNVQTRPLLLTSGTSLAITDEKLEVFMQGLDPDFDRGPFATIALSSKYTFNEDYEQVFSNILVYGSSLMLSQQLTNATYYNNGEYFLSIVNKMTGRAGGINIVAKNLAPENFEMDMQKYKINRNIFQYALPLVILAGGCAVWFVRRHK